MCQAHVQSGGARCAGSLDVFARLLLQNQAAFNGVLQATGVHQAAQVGIDVPLGMLLDLWLDRWAPAMRSCCTPHPLVQGRPCSLRQVQAPRARPLSSGCGSITACALQVGHHSQRGPAQAARAGAVPAAAAGAQLRAERTAGCHSEHHLGLHRGQSACGRAASSKLWLCCASLQGLALCGAAVPWNAPSPAACCVQLEARPSAADSSSLQTAYLPSGFEGDTVAVLASEDAEGESGR